MTTVMAPTSRGGLLLRIVVAGIALATVAIVVAAIGVGVPERSPGPAWVRGAAVSVVRADGPVYVRSADAFLVAVGPGRALAISARSPHLGEAVQYCASAGWFQDPAHGAMFDGLGRYVMGPAPRGLDRFAVRYVGGVIWIDPDAVTQGPPRGTPHTRPAGAFCFPPA